MTMRRCLVIAVAVLVSVLGTTSSASASDIDWPVAPVSTAR
ncbi:hypothetical protein O7600_01125 [Micromonospora sp. WMMA1998]|nr:MULTISPECIES: hypothetical protein [Micromonospora]WBC15465.1 hypothetical protein O7600_01125 [Micromonospora sp. WMMA1998]